MTNGKTPTFKDLYELVDKRGNVTDDKIDHLTDRFDKMEAGRLTLVESRLAQVEAIAEKNTQNRYRWQSYLIPGLVYIVGQALMYMLLKP